MNPRAVESATKLFDAYFYDNKRYDLMRVGRYKFNKKLGIATRIAGHESAYDPFWWTARSMW